MNKLTKKSRWMIYLSLFLSGFIIFSAIIYFSAAKNGIDDRTQNKLLLVIIIIAVLAVIGIVITRLKLYKNTKNLSPEYFKAYENISDKLTGIAVSNLEKKEILNDILDIFLLADKDNRNISDVVGEDIDSFVNQICESLGYRNNIIFSFLTGLQYTVIYVFMLQVYQALTYAQYGFFNQKISISIIFLLAATAFFGIPLINKFIRKNNILAVIAVPVAIMVLFISLMETLSKFFADIPWVYSFTDGDINLFPNIYMLMLWIVIIISATLLKALQRRLSIAKL